MDLSFPIYLQYLLTCLLTLFFCFVFIKVVTFLAPDYAKLSKNKCRIFSFLELTSSKLVQSYCKGQNKNQTAKLSPSRFLGSCRKSYLQSAEL